MVAWSSEVEADQSYISTSERDEGRSSQSVSSDVFQSGCSRSSHSVSSDVFRSFSLRSPAAFKRLTTDDTIEVEGTFGGAHAAYRVVYDQIPEDLKPLLQRPLTEQERDRLFHRVDLLSAEHIPPPCRPTALWIFGPPAVGKSTMSEELSTDIFGRPSNAVVVDGDDVRQVHEGFRKVAEHGLRNRVVHADAWQIMKQTKIVQQAKKEVFRAAISRRQNLKIPDCSTNTNRVLSMLRELEENDYDLFAICIWAPELETQLRGRARSVKAGKVFSTRSYLAACRGALEMGRLWEQKLAEGAPNFKAVLFHDNTVRPSHPVHLAQFEVLVNLTADEAILHADLCKASRDSHVRADVAASQARASGSPPLEVAQLWLRQVSADAGRQPSFRPVGVLGQEPPSDPPPGYTEARDLASLMLAERRRGQLQGVLLGLLLVAAVSALRR